MPIERDGIRVEDSERQPCEVWTRVMGYFRPVACFNRGKQGEYRDRVVFREDAGMRAIETLEATRG